MRNILSVVGKIKNVGELTEIRRVGKPDLNKKIVTFVTQGGDIIHFEIRNKKLEEYKYLLDDHRDQYLKVSFFFDGSIKGDVTYNNIVINDIHIVQ